VGRGAAEGIRHIERVLNQPTCSWLCRLREPFVLHTDAFFQGLGAVLYQRQGDVDRVICYASRSLKESEGVPSAQTGVSCPQVVGH